MSGASKIANGSAAGPEKAPSALFKRCRELLDAELPAAALPHLHELMNRERSLGGVVSGSTFLMLGECCLRLRRFSEAEAALGEALLAAGDVPLLVAEARLLLAELHAATHRPDQAGRCLDDAGALLGNYPEPGLETRRLLALADLGRTRGEYDQAEALLARARSLAAGLGRPTLRGRIALASALLAWAKGDLPAASEKMGEAAAQASSVSATHLMAEIHLQCGVLAGQWEARAASHESALPHAAAHYLARAQELFSESGSLEDLERLRHYFRLYGRRATDRVADATISKTAEDVFECHLELSRLVDGLLVTLGREGNAALAEETIADREDAFWEALAGAHGALHGALVSLSRKTDRLVGAAHSSVVERDHLRDLLDGVRRLHADLESEQLTRDVVELVASVLDADRVVLALVSRKGEMKAREELGMGGKDDCAWRILAESVRRSGESALEGTAPPALGPPREDVGEAPPLGHAMAVPIGKRGQVQGVLYADRQARGGLLSHRDLRVLEVIATQVGTILERGRMTWALRMAARLRDTTMEAISDGVMAVGLDGEVRSANSAACRLLGVPKDRLEGSRLSDLSGLHALIEAAVGEEEAEERLLRLPGGEAMVSVRRVRDDSGADAGTVITLTGLQKAQRAAGRIVGARARYTFADILGSSAVFQEQVRLAEAAARADAGVLITGESGTGKEVMAQAIHNASRRAKGPFVGINCAAIPRDLLESELFGHEEGAFTGSRRGGQPGKFELAQGGTILLDEIGDMPLEMQAKLLRVLQERCFLRVGGRREIILDARILATTNRNLEDLAAESRFRHDLLFRLQVIHIELPPLRERIEDIPIFVEAFLGRASSRLSKRLRRVAPHVMEAFVGYSWPGNIRELEYVVESEANLVDPESEELDRMPSALRPAQRRRRETLVGIPLGDERRRRLSSGSFTLEHVEREAMEAALREHQGNVPEVAKALGVSRGTVYNKLRKYDLDLLDFRGGTR